MTRRHSHTCESCGATVSANDLGALFLAHGFTLVERRERDSVLRHRIAATTP